MVGRTAKRNVSVDALRQRCCQPAPPKLGMSISLHGRHALELLTCCGPESGLGS